MRAASGRTDFVDMVDTRTVRHGTTYYLHIRPQRGGGIQHIPTDPAGPLADSLPEALIQPIERALFP